MFKFEIFTVPADTVLVEGQICHDFDVIKQLD